MSFSAKLYLLVVGSVGVLTSLFFAGQLSAYELSIALIVLSLASFIAEIYELEVVPHWGLSTATAIKLAAVFIGGGPLAVWVVILSTLPAEVILSWDKLKEGFSAFFVRVFFNVGQLLLSVISAALVFDFVGDHDPPFLSVQDLVPIGIAFLVYEIVNNSLVFIIVSIVTKQKLAFLIRFGFRNLHLQFITIGVISILIANLYATSILSFILALIPLAVVHYSTRSYLRLRRTSHAAFSRITELLSQRDVYTGAHSKEVEELGLSLAQALELPDERIEAIKMGAAIHDIGKIAVPDAILHKPGKLTDEEWIVMKKHPIVGADIIKDLEIYRDVVPIVRHEHEHWDGGGYPDGLKGEAIPLGARIIAVADVYSALTTERHYRPPQGKPLKYTQEQACEVLKEMAGKVLDPHLVDVFINKVIKKVKAQ